MCGHPFVVPVGGQAPQGWQQQYPQAVDQNRWIIALLLCFFVGHVGAHRFYMGHTSTGITILVLQLVGWLTVCIFVGFIPLAIVAVWWIVDLVLILTNGLRMADGTPLKWP